MNIFRPLKLTMFAIILSILPTSFVLAETVTVGSLVIEAPWARASIGTKRPAVVFLKLRNQGSVADVLTAVETPVSGKASVHRSQITNGVASMTMAGPVKIPANSEVRLAPGGLHIMLMMLKKPLIKGKDFSLTLVFKKTGRVEITVPVLSVGARGPEQK